MPLKGGSPFHPRGGFIDALFLPSHEYRQAIARAYMELEMKFDQLAICDPHRQIPTLEIKELSERLGSVESHFHMINELEQRQTMTKHRHQLLREELSGMQVSMGVTE
ncbi:hypothetical protein KSP39_PZI016892 [Platanthera zijinensis]|uniref:Uncharacterized protein n=1 Tax=Platanthera zijinensis TaxID=2320716 RepID=A0AAP0B936_9ASPA